MDPVSAIISIADVALRITSALIEYTKSAAHASGERKVLLDEALALARLLEKLKARRPASNEDAWLQDNWGIIPQFKSAYNDLAKQLSFDPDTGKSNSQSRLQSAVFAAKWKFSKAEVYCLVERITRLQQYALALLVDDQYVMVEQINNRQLDEAVQQHKTEVLRWLSPMQDESDYNTILGRAAKGSGTWFLESSLFREWYGGKTACLWCSGAPGAGKTVIATLVLDYIRRQQRSESNPDQPHGLAFTYLKYNNPQQSLASVVGSLLRQLLEKHQELPVEINAVYESHQKGLSPPNADELARLLLLVMDSFVETFVIIDALDECDEQLRWDLVQTLQSCQPHAKVMITSRGLEAIAAELVEYSRFEIRAHAQDIELYIDAFVERHRHLRRVVDKSSAIRADIKTAVIRNAEDMFLLARLHLESISDAASLSMKHVRQRLSTLPSSLEETYNEALARIEGQAFDQRSLALKTLAWVSYAFRPLTVHELQHALAIEPGDTELDEESFIETHNITSLCAGLIVVDAGSNAVNLVHHTAKRHFEGIRAQKFPGFHAVVTMSCATYLSLPQLKDLSITKIISNFPLACYAAQHMGEHARQNPEDALESSVLRAICQLLAHPEKRRPLLSLLDGLTLSKGGMVQAIQVSDTDDASTSSAYDSSDEEATLFEVQPSVSEAAWQSHFRASHMVGVTALHLAASMGLAKVASLLLKEVPNVDAADESGKTALSVAMERGFEKAVKLLVDNGAVIDLSTTHGQGVFLRIVESDWTSVADVVTSRIKMRSKASDLEGRKALLLTAAYENSATEIQRLQSPEIMRSQLESTLAVALFICMERQSVALVEQLLASGVNVDARDSSGQTALHRAVRRQNTTIVALLIDRGCAIDARDDEGRTPWSANLRVPATRVLEMLIEAGADPNTRGHQGISELYTAGENGDLDVIKLMVRFGTNPSIRTQFRWTPLHWASYYGHTECVKYLLNAGAEPSPISDQDATPLDLAIKAQQPETIRLLRRAGGKESREVAEIDGGVVKDPTAYEWSRSVEVTENQGKETAKLSLTFDKLILQGIDFGQFLYPATAVNPTDYIYQLSALLSAPGESLSFRRAHRRVDMVEYPIDAAMYQGNDSLFKIERNSIKPQALRLCSGPGFPEVCVIEMSRDWTGGWKVWRIREDGSDYLFRTTADWSKARDVMCRWTTEDGTLLARTDSVALLPVITFEYGPDRVLQEILIGCWIAKLWHESTPPNLTSLTVKSSAKTSRRRFSQLNNE